MNGKTCRIAATVASGIMAGLAAHAALADRLPVYKLAPPTIDKARSSELLTSALRPAPGVAVVAPTLQEDQLRLTQRAGTRVVDVDKRSGHVFIGDMSQLWNPQLKPALPAPEQAKVIADNYLKANKLLPAAQPNFEFVFSHVSETMGGSDVPGSVERVLLDRQVNYKALVTARGADGKAMQLPVIGGGGKLRVSIGDRGSVIGFAGGWRNAVAIASEEEIKPQAAAVAEFQKRYGGLRLQNIRAELGYYAAPAFEQQDVLAPVWIVNAQIQAGGELVPMRSQIIAATKYGPVFKPEAPLRPRDPRAPAPRVDEDESAISPKARLETPRGFMDFFVTPAQAATGFECGTSWIGTSQGLSGSSGNRQGFVDHCRAAGWAVNFDWGDLNAWESDFRANDDNYVDGADLVFYTGHASQNGWVLNVPDDTFLRFSEIGGASDLYGNTDLEWLIIAACGPLQSTHFVGNTTNAFDRWRGIFDGLHVLLGYGAVTFDNTSEGRRFMELTRAGWNVIDAWFRTAQEIQPATNGFSAPDGPTIYVVAMYAHNGNHCARNDHLWGMGSTCPDVTGASQQRYMMWSGT